MSLFVLKGKVNARASLAAVGIGFWLTMAGGVSAGPNGGERIIGGNVADPADWPFIAAITTRNGAQFCGGSVIAKDAVVTAAHCMFDYFGRPLKRREVRVVTGRPDLRDESEGKSIRVGRITVHQDYRRNGHRDVAVLNLARNTPADPVDLPTPEEADAETTPGSELWVAGWGGTKPNGAKPSDVLLDVAVYAISDEECEPNFSYFRADEEVCAYGARPGRQPLQRLLLRGQRRPARGRHARRQAPRRARLLRGSRVRREGAWRLRRGRQEPQLHRAKGPPALALAGPGMRGERERRDSNPRPPA